MKNLDHLPHRTSRYQKKNSSPGTDTQMHLNGRYDILPAPFKVAAIKKNKVGPEILIVF